MNGGVSIKWIPRKAVGSFASCILACLGVAIVTLLITAKPQPVSAFASFNPPGNIHAHITRDALRLMGFNPCSISWVIDGNVSIDWSEFISSQLSFGLTELDRIGAYRPVHHFDRPDPDDLRHIGSKTHFKESAQLIEAKRAEVASLLKSGDLEGALEALGASLHTLQDFFAHSNFIDLGADQPDLGASQRAQALSALDYPDLFDPKDPSIPDIELTAYSPVPFGSGIDPEAPPSDPSIGCPPQFPGYSHRACAKDSIDKNAEVIKPANDPAHICPTGTCTKYTAAYWQATLASEHYIGLIENNYNLSSDQINALKNAPNGVSGPCKLGGGSPISRPTEGITSGDPNDKTGSLGVGPLQYISGGTPLRYAIEFSNEPNATASVQSIAVTESLDISNDDLRTFNLGPISIPNQIVSPPPGLADFNTTVDLRPANNLLVAIATHLNATTGVLTWTFQSLDPATNAPPADPSAGFVPPGAGGSVFFTVMPKQSVATDTQIQNQAIVVFDKNPPISTPIWSNAIDKTPPMSHVLALSTNSGSSGFLVQWTGSDVGSGVHTYTVFVSDNGGAFTAWQTNTPAASASFSGQSGHTYGFYSIATDNVGNVEAAKTVAEATTQVIGQASQTISFAPPASPVVYGVAPITLSALATSGLPVTFSIVSGPATVIGNTLAITGAGTVVVAANQGGSSSYLAAPQVTQSIIVNKALSSASLTGNPNPVLVQNAVTLTAAVTSTAGTPTGTVTFLDGSTPLGNVTLSGGVATFTASSLTSGSHAISVTYGGDNNFLAASSSPTLTELVQDFSFNVTAPSVTALPGGTAKFSFTATPTGGSTFPSTVTLAASGLPAGANSSFSPQSLTAGSGTSTVTLNVAIPQTQAGSERVKQSHGRELASHRSRGSAGLARRLAPLSLALILLPFAGKLQRTSKRLSRMMSFLLILAAGFAAFVGMNGCGTGSGYFAFGQKNYTVTITGTSGALSHSATVNLTVE